jgi:hypothetical protein
MRKIYLADKGRAPTESELLAMLGRLAELLGEIEKRHDEAESFDSDPVGADRLAMYDSLELALGFLQSISVQSRPLNRLLTALDAIIYGSKVPAEFRLAGIARPDAPAVLAIRGTLAGLAEAIYRFDEAEFTEEANDEVARLLSEDLGVRVSRRRGKITARMVSDWRAEYGGKNGEPGHARNNYLRIKKICEDWHSAGFPIPIHETISEVERAAIESLPLQRKSG